MNLFRCAHCRRQLPKDPRVKNQKYCGRKPCQNARKNKWLQKKLTTDEEVKADKDESQKDWCSRNKGYWKRYREDHPEYVERNRQQQLERNRRKRASFADSEQDASLIAKKDALESFFNGNTASYFLYPATEDVIAKKDALLVKIIPISSS